MLTVTRVSDGAVLLKVLQCFLSLARKSTLHHQFPACPLVNRSRCVVSRSGTVWNYERPRPLRACLSTVASQSLSGVLFLFFFFPMRKKATDYHTCSPSPTRTVSARAALKETGRTFSSLESGDSSHVTFDFSAVANKLYGMGQNRHQDNGGGLGLNVINQTYNFEDSIGEEGGPSNSLPYVLGANPSTGFHFGILFNSPALGGVAHTGTTMT